MIYFPISWGGVYPGFKLGVTRSTYKRNLILMCEYYNTFKE